MNDLDFDFDLDLDKNKKYKTTSKYVRTHTDSSKKIFMKVGNLMIKC